MRPIVTGFDRERVRYRGSGVVRRLDPAAAPVIAPVIAPVMAIGR